MAQILNTLGIAKNGVVGFVSKNPIISTVGAVSTVGLAAGAITVARKRKSRATKKRKSSVRRRKTSKRRSHRKCRGARTAGKRKDTSTRRIRMTKNGQPYVILKSGKARFIKKSSCRRSKKVKGGRY